MAEHEIKMHEVEPLHPAVAEAPLRPSLRIRFEDLPEAKDWRNGRKYEVHIIGRQVSSDEHGCTIELEKIGGEAKAGERHSRMEEEE
jgi:hypothetical protein